MIMNSDMVFCVECNTIISKGNADKIFKTGFYKTIMPLAHCKTCACSDAKAVSVEIVPDKLECSSGYSMPISLLA